MEGGENRKPKIVSIVGLTTSGKTALGIQIAKQFNGEVISADSRQVYCGLDIGTAKVTKEEQAIVKHHLIDVAPAGGHFDVFAFQEMGYKAIDDILTRKKLPIIVGGTGLYSRSIVEGYNFKNGDNAPRYNVLQICLMPSKEFIRPLVEKRIDVRLEQGMIEETRSLIAEGVSEEWLRALGLEYYWNMEYIDGYITIDEYKEQLATKTMQYEKRQRTWFKKEQDTHFMEDPETYYNDTVKLVKDFIK